MYKSQGERNFDAINTVMRFDGDIPLRADGTAAGKQCWNQADFIAEEDGRRLFYVSLDEHVAEGATPCPLLKDVSVEAYVVVGKDGNISYTESHGEARGEIYVDGKFTARAGSDFEELVNGWVDTYRVEGGAKHIKPGAVRHYYDLLGTRHGW